MLTVSKIGNIEYYSNLAKEDYYLDSGEPCGKWAGRGADLLGLSNLIDVSQYKNIMHGFTPDKKYSLCRNAGLKHRNGHDLTFSAPKSVSIAWARSDQNVKVKIEHIHEKGVLAALDFLEKHAATTRRNSAEKSREKVIGLVAALFEHSTSRAQDPQLHTHCLIANVAPRKDGSWGTLESRDFYLWQKAAGAIYRAELARELSYMGFTVERDSEAFKLKEIPDEICDHFSKRGEVIRKELKRRGNANSASKVGDIATLSTRKTKKEINRKKLYSKWFEEFDSLGFNQSNLVFGLGNDRDNHCSIVEKRKRSQKSLDIKMINALLTERNSTFREQDVYKVAAELAQVTGCGAKKSQQLAKMFIDSDDVLSLGIDYKFNSIFTTSEIVDNERCMIASAMRLRRGNKFTIESLDVHAAIIRKEFSLSEEQTEAVEAVCGGQHFAILQGSAGAGKSASMDCVRMAYEGAGYKVIGACIAKSAANNLAKEANVETYTIAKLISDIEGNKSKLSDNTVLLIDEAGQLSSRHLSKLLSVAEINGSKVILVGEDKQLDAIEHAGSLKYLSQPSVLGATRIEIIRRQRSDWAKQSVADFRDGNALAALYEYKKRNLLHFSPDSKKTKEELINYWNHFRKSNSNKKSLILAQRWQDVTDLNAQVRKVLQLEGSIDEYEIEVKCSVSQRPMTHMMAKGERVRFTRNDYRYGHTNGDLGTIYSIESLPDGDVKFVVSKDDGNQVTFKSSDYSDDKNQVYLTQAYAQTVYASQGLTVDGDVFVYYTTGMDRAHTYVACSRHKDNCHIFSNERELSPLAESFCQQDLLKILAKKMSSEVKKHMAIEYLRDESSLSKQFNLQRSLKYC